MANGFEIAPRKVEMGKTIRANERPLSAHVYESKWTLRYRPQQLYEPRVCGGCSTQ